MFVWLLIIAEARRLLPEYEINLDLAPGERFIEVFTDYNQSMIDTVNDLIKGEVKSLLLDLVEKRGPEPDELQEEINCGAKLTGIDLAITQGMQYLYELQTLMVPIEYVKLPWSGPGCTGIIAKDSNDGSVYHARNLDFAPKKYMNELLYIAKFMKNDTEVFRAQMIAGYQGLITAMKFGSNGFTVEINTRYTGHLGGNAEMLENLVEEKRPLNNWSVRMILETAADYEEAVTALSNVKYVATVYNIVSGNGKGTILAREPDGVAHKLVLGEHNYENADDYIIETNFDYWDNDFREYLDPSAGEIGHARRVVAQAILNKTDVLTPQVLFDVLNTEGVIAKDTIFQAIMNVEKSIWNVSAVFDL